MNKQSTEAATKTKKLIRNGVDLNALRETLRAINERPELASFQFRAKNNWIDGGFNRSTIKEFYGVCQEDSTRERSFVMEADEPPVLLSQDRGANPVEYVLHALAACLTTSLVYHAAARGIEITALNSNVSGDLDLRGFLGISETVKKGYQRITIKFNVKTSHACTEADLRACALFSPVYDMISASLPINLEFKVS